MGRGWGSGLGWDSCGTVALQSEAGKEWAGAFPPSLQEASTHRTTHCYPECQPPWMAAPPLSQAQTKTHGNPGLGQVPGWPGCPLGVQRSLQSQDPGLDGWGPRAPPSIPSSSPGPRAGLGSSLQPELPGHPLARLGGPLLDGQKGGTLPCCGLSTLLGRAGCQGLQVPDWIPAPFQGASGKQAQASPSRGMHLPRPLFPSSRPALRHLDTPALLTQPSPSLASSPRAGAGYKCWTGLRPTAGPNPQGCPSWGPGKGQGSHERREGDLPRQGEEKTTPF